MSARLAAVTDCVAVSGLCCRRDLDLQARHVMCLVRRQEGDDISDVGRLDPLDRQLIEKHGQRRVAIEQVVRSRAAAATIAVGTPVGWPVLIRMPWRASSLASERAKPTTPCLAAAYRATNGRPLMRASS